MHTSYHIAALAAALWAAAPLPGRAQASGDAPVCAGTTVREDSAAGIPAAEDPAAQAFPEEGDAAAVRQRLADALPVGELAARWRVRGSHGGGVRQFQSLEWEPHPGMTMRVAAERDPGEASWSDFLSAYVEWTGPRASVAAGDLRPGFGQGLVFGRSGARRGSSPRPQKDRARAGYRSTAESAAVRGLLVRVQRQALSAAVLVSRLCWDGRVSDDDVVTSVLESGLHVTSYERAARDRLRGRAIGAALRWQGTSGAAGLQVAEVEYSHRLDLRRTGKVAEAFRGRGQRLVSVDALWGGPGARAYAEAAADTGGRAATVAGVEVGPRRLRVRALLYRYPAAWHSPLGSAYSGSGMSNEQGIHTEVAGRGWRVFACEHRRLESAYTHPLPQPTWTWGGQVERRLGPVWRLAAAVQARHGVEYSGGEERPLLSRRVRLDAERRHRGHRWRVRGQAQLARQARAVELARAVSVAWRWRGAAGELSLLGTGFRVPSYSARLYEYEAELPGAVSILPLYGTGVRVCALGRVGWGQWGAGLRYRHKWVRGNGGDHEAALQVDLETR